MSSFPSPDPEVLDALWRNLTEQDLLSGPIDFFYLRSEEDALMGALDFWLQEHVALFRGYHFESLGGSDSGSDMVLCRYPGLSSARPVLSVGVAGTLGVVAASEAALLRQLASGLVWDDAADAWVPPPVDWDWRPLQRMVSDALGGVEGDPNTAMAAARAAHPTLTALIQTLLSARDGSDSESSDGSSSHGSSNGSSSNGASGD